MSTVIRYDLVGEYDPLMQQMQEGDYVLYSSYMALQQKHTELLAAAKKAHSRIGKKDDGDFDAMGLLESAIAKAGG